MNDPVTIDEAAVVRRSVAGLARRLRAERPERSVSLATLGLLGSLHRHGAMAPGELAALERIRPQSLTRTLAALEGQRLVTRGPDPGDRRRVIVELTRAGRETLARDMRQRDAWLALAMTRLTPAERGLLRLAAGLMDRITRDEEVRALRTPHRRAS
jgi:DNA-binding MarR family transcriptional regulator